MPTARRWPVCWRNWAAGRSRGPARLSALPMCRGNSTCRKAFWGLTSWEILEHLPWRVRSLRPSAFSSTPTGCFPPMERPRISAPSGRGLSPPTTARGRWTKIPGPSASGAIKERRVHVIGYCWIEFFCIHPLFSGTRRLCSSGKTSYVSPRFRPLACRGSK